VQVNSVSPGATMTGRRRAMLEKAAASKKITLEEAKREFLKQAGISRLGEAEEIADVMAFVVSPSTRWMTGTVVRIDGGEVKSV
jgi:3-oxoacyl-[acyl-carrier protein] reductase